MLKKILVSTICIALAACGGGGSSDNGGNGGNNTPQLQFTNLDAASSMTTVSSTSTQQNVLTENLLGYDDTGAEYELSNVKVDQYQALSNGIYVDVTEEHSRTYIDENGGSQTESISTPAKYFVQLNGTYNPIKTDGNFIGQNEDDTLIFSNVDTFDTKKLKLISLNSGLENPTVQFLTGNFALIYGESSGSYQYQLLDTISSLRYNVENSNIAAISSTKLLMVGKGIFDMTDGSISSNDNDGWFNNDTVFNPNQNGTILLSVQQGNATACQSPDNCLYSVSSDGVSTQISTTPFKVDDSGTRNSEADNKNLFVSDSYIVVRELTQVSIFDRTSSDVSSILQGYNIMSISLRSDMVYITSEDNYGNPHNGVYNIKDDTFTSFNDTDSFNAIKALQK